MNSNAQEESKRGYGRAANRHTSWPAEEEELETGEPIPDETEPAPAVKKIPGRGQFNRQPPSRADQPDQSNQTETSNAPGGQMVLSTAKYLKTNPDDDLDFRKDKKKNRGSSESENSGGSFESKVLNGGTGAGALAMGGAALWFVIGLMNDTIFFYPPILFILGLIAFFKGLAKNE